MGVSRRPHEKATVSTVSPRAATSTSGRQTVETVRRPSVGLPTPINGGVNEITRTHAAVRWQFLIPYAAYAPGALARSFSMMPGRQRNT
jgi:hypothetical protein